MQPTQFRFRKNRVRRAFDGAWKIRRLDSCQLRDHPCALEDTPSKVIPRALPLRADVVQSKRSGHNQASGYFSKVYGIGRGKNLVSDHADRVSSGCFLQHILHKIATLPAAACRPVQAAGPDDEISVAVALNQVLPDNLGDTVIVHRGR